MVKDKNRKEVLITGAGAGIGLAVTKKFLAEDWQVVAHYHHNHRELTQLSKKYANQLEIIQANFGDRKSLEQFINKIKKHSFSALVNNAGIHDFSRQSKDRIKSIEEVMMVNTIAPILIAEVVLENMKTAGGSIVNIRSIGVKFGSVFASVFYSVSKSGLEAMTKTFAREGAPHNILVNTIRVGVTDTSFHDKLGKNMQERQKLIPLKRMAKPQEIAEFIFFLTAKNSYITGETIAISGGE